MQVHVIRAEGYPIEQYEQVMQELNNVAGLIIFHEQKAQILPLLSDPVTVGQAENQYNTVSKISQVNDSFNGYGWDYFFGQCQAYREALKLSDKDLVILLTPERNSMRWLANADNIKKHNIFIKTSEWSDYIACDAVYPTAYVVMSQVLQSMFYDSSKERELFGHREPLGCMNDFCPDKSDVVYKLRTADICSECLEEMLARAIPQEYIIQALELFEKLRKEMLFKQRYRFKLAHRAIHITRSTGRNRGITIRFPDLNKEVKLNPKRSVLYLFYLNHPEGILNSRLKKKIYKDELSYLYYNFCEGDTANRAAKHASVVKCLTRETKGTDSDLTHLRNAFRDVLGDSMAEDYIIHSLSSEGDSKKGIRLNRSLVTFDQSVSEYIMGKYFSD